MTALCGLWNGSCAGTNCCAASQGIVDTGFASPTIANAAGDGQWMAEDAFVGVQSSVYWSATELGGNAWFVFLGDGNVGTDFKGDPDVYVWPVLGGQ